MAFELRLSLVVSSDSEECLHQRSGFEMTWAERAAAKLVEKEREQKRQEEIAAQQRSQVVSNAPYIWQALVEKLQKEVNAFNKFRPDSLSMTPLIDNKVRLNSERGTVELAFDPAAPAIKFDTVRRETGSTNHNSGTVKFMVVQREVMLRTDDSSYANVDALAEELLNLLV
jgi:hypothetical protein